MMLLAIAVSVFLLWSASGFLGLPRRAKGAVHLTVSVLLVVALGSLVITGAAIP